MKRQRARKPMAQACLVLVLASGCVAGPFPSCFDPDEESIPASPATERPQAEQPTTPASEVVPAPPTQTQPDRPVSPEQAPKAPSAVADSQKQDRDAPPPSG
jgi:cytoskeletal protein RodZ